MVVSEVVNSKMQSLPVAAQTEVLHFVEFLSQKYEHQESEDKQWSEFSLDSAMKGLEDETPYDGRGFTGKMALIKAGQIVLFRFPNTDLVLGSLRPSLLVAPIPSSYDDWLVCMISSQMHQAIPNFDEIILTTDADFAQTRLKSESVLRLSRLAVVSETIFVGKLGEISQNRLEKVKENLADWIKN